MRCVGWCLPQGEERETPLLLNAFSDSNILRDENVHGILEMMRKRTRSQQMQAQSYENEAEEERAKARMAIQKEKPDKILAEHHLELALRADENYASELAQCRNLALMVDTIDRALKDLELSQHFVHANATLGELMEQMPADLDGLLDNIKESMYMNTTVSKSLSKQLVRPNTQKRALLDDEMDKLMGPKLPEGVPAPPPPPLGETKTAKKVQ